MSSTQCETSDFSCASYDQPQDLVTEFLPVLREDVEGKVALEIAAGRGRNIPFLLSRGYKVTALEWTEGVSKVCFPNELITAPPIREKWEQQRVVIVDQDFCVFTVEPESFDVIVAINFLQVLIDPMAHALRMVRWLKPGGRLIARLIAREVVIEGTRAQVLSEEPQKFCVQTMWRWFDSLCLVHSAERWIYVPTYLGMSKPRVLTTIDFVADKPQ